MDPGWPANPSNTLICILCKSAMPFHNRNPERFFRHLLADHCTYFNLNLLLEISLMQPHAVREENQPVSDGVLSAADSVLDQVKVQPIKKERRGSSSNVVEPDSTSTQEPNQFLSQFGTNNSSRDNYVRNVSLEENCRATLPGLGSSSFNPTVPPQSAYPVQQQANVPMYHNLQPPVKVPQPRPVMPNSDQLNQEDISDFDLSFFINQITQPDTDLKPPATTPQPSALSTFIPYESKPTPFMLQSRDPYLHQDNKPYTPNMFTMTVPPDFSTLDPISFVKQEPRSKRKVTRQETVNKNNQPVPCLPDNPNRHLVPEDLQMLIYYQNPTRGIKFTYSQRMNTQMVVDDFVLKKKKGPYLTRGGRVVNWKCINDSCQYTAVTWEGQIQDTARQHNHPSQPELYVKKQARVKVRENVAQEATNVVQGDKDNPVTNAVMDVVTDTNPEMRNMIGSIDALKQAARRYNRKLHRDPLQGVQPSNMLLAPNGEDIYVPSSVYENYEVVGEFPADFQFSVEVSDQVGHYTEVSTAGGQESERKVITEEVVVPVVPVYKSEQVTVEEETGVIVSVDASEQVIETIPTEINELVSPEQITESEKFLKEVDSENYPNVVIDSEKYSQDTIDCEKYTKDESVSGKYPKDVIDCEKYPKDDVEELLEPSPTKEDPLKDEFNC